MKTNTLKRWALVNKYTDVVRAFRATRATARSAKRSTERIYDMVNGVYVR